MDRLIAKDAILETVYTLAYGIDDLDHASITSVLRSNGPITFDISAILDTPVKDISAEEYFKMACGALGGFDATHHQLGCPLITFPGEGDNSAAHVKVYVTALHVMETQFVTARVSWNLDVEKEGGKWIIRKFVIKRSVPLDNPALMEKAHKRVEEGFMRAKK